MNTSEIKEALQDLINRLLDAESGFREVAKGTSHAVLREHLNTYAQERHTMHQALEGYSKQYGDTPDVSTTFLGELHKVFIDIKLSATNVDSEFESIVDEVERGSTTLLEDYDKVIDEVEMPEHISTTLQSQRATIQRELDNLTTLRDHLDS